MAARQDATDRHPSLPEGWREAPLSTIADVRFSSVDKLAYPSEEPVRLCNYLDVYKNDYITGDLGFMRASATQPEIDRFGLQVGDIVVTKDSETPYDIGIPAVVDYAAPDLVCGYHLGLIRPDKAEIDPTFLAKQLGHARIAGYLAGQANGLTRYGLPIGSVMATPLWLPPLAEQQAAGRLLRLVDQAIAQTQAVIAKLKQIRTGLLHDLLTRGLDENGELRDPVLRPDLFRDSPAGRVPVDWDVRALRECLTENPQNGIYKPASSIGRHGALLIGQTCITADRLLDFTHARRVDISADESERFALLNGDVLISRVFATLSGVGQPALVTELAEPSVYESNMMRLRVKAKSISPELLFFWLRQDFIRRILLARVNLSNQASVNQKVINLLPLGVPNAHEQTAMVRAIDSLVHRCRNPETVWVPKPPTACLHRSSGRVWPWSC